MMNEYVGVRMRTAERKAIQKALEKDEYIDTQSDFIRVAVIKELRKRGFLPKVYEGEFQV